jgi:hypothetical protein
MQWCEQQPTVHFVFGVARDERLRRIIAPELAQAAAEHVFCFRDYAPLLAGAPERLVTNRAPPM